MPSPLSDFLVKNVHRFNLNGDVHRIRKEVWELAREIDICMGNPSPLVPWAERPTNPQAWQDIAAIFRNAVREASAENLSKHGKVIAFYYLEFMFYAINQGVNRSDIKDQHLPAFDSLIKPEDRSRRDEFNPNYKYEKLMQKLQNDAALCEGFAAIIETIPDPFSLRQAKIPTEPYDILVKKVESINVALLSEADIHSHLHACFNEAKLLKSRGLASPMGTILDVSDHIDNTSVIQIRPYFKRLNHVSRQESTEEAAKRCVLYYMRTMQYQFSDYDIKKIIRAVISPKENHVHQTAEVFVLNVARPLFIKETRAYTEFPDTQSLITEILEPFSDITEITVEVISRLNEENNEPLNVLVQLCKTLYPHELYLGSVLSTLFQQLDTHPEKKWLIKYVIEIISFISKQENTKLPKPWVLDAVKRASSIPDCDIEKIVGESKNYRLIEYFTQYQEDMLWLGLSPDNERCKDKNTELAISYLTRVPQNANQANLFKAKGLLHAYEAICTRGSHDNEESVIEPILPSPPVEPVQPEPRLEKDENFDSLLAHFIVKVGFNANQHANLEEILKRDPFLYQARQKPSQAN